MSVHSNRRRGPLLYRTATDVNVMSPTIEVFAIEDCYWIICV